jgi:hypothetical protein
MYYENNDTINIDTINIDTINIDTINNDTINIDTINNDTINIAKKMKSLNKFKPNRFDCFLLVFPQMKV